MVDFAFEPSNRRGPPARDMGIRSTVEGYYTHTVQEAALEFEVPLREMRSMLNTGLFELIHHNGKPRIHLGPRRGQPVTVQLWHGTSLDRARLILDGGFDNVTQGRQVWLTTRDSYARKAAIRRAEHSSQ